MRHTTEEDVSFLHPAPPGFVAFSEIADPLVSHVGPMYQRLDDTGERIGAFFVTARHLDQTGGSVLHEGMLLLAADLFLGLTAFGASQGRRCVTLGLNASRLGVARLGDLVEIRPRIDGVAPSIIQASARISTHAGIIMNISSHWKILGAS
ncbi:hypothetical protein PTW32_01405 [Dechloromonas agitata]|uniref:PaaI family thioesterase n=1 Tax=Dechloromonas agitata TaxID=73030 RepID=UPI00237DF078|nr:hypothetical protein [Dechloromonas agitata]MDE1544057.1 hypothetical protein [Dechloromonas agitata]